MTPVLPTFPPPSPTILKIIYLLAGNMNTVIPYSMFEEIMPSLDATPNIHSYVTRVRPWMRANGLWVDNIKDKGYRCTR